MTAIKSKKRFPLFSDFTTLFFSHSLSSQLRCETIGGDQLWSPPQLVSPPASCGGPVSTTTGDTIGGWKEGSNFSVHIFEIKQRIQYVFFSIACAFIISYIKSFQLLHLFLLSFVSFQNEEKFFIFTDIHEAFSITITVCLFTTFMVCLPLICYQTFCFLLPSWHNYESQRRNKLLITLLVFWYLYILLLHLYFIPELCSFLLEFQINASCLIIKLEARILSYVSWTIRLFFVFTIFFAFIIIVIWGVKIGFIKLELLMEKRQYALLASLLFAAIISPPEFVFQGVIVAFTFILIEFLQFIRFLFKSLKNVKRFCLAHNL